MKKLILALPLALLLMWPVVAVSDGNVSRETASQLEEPTEVTVSATTTLKASQIALQAAVASAFADVPSMVAVARCESHFRQFGSNGKPLISPTNDVGVMQLNIPTWGPLAKLLRLDIYNSASDNIAMARIVYRQQGVRAWTCKG